MTTAGPLGGGGLQTLLYTYTTTYYVDATNGNDAWDGLSPETAWKTIGKVNGSTFAGDTGILFKRGETWTSPLIPHDSGTDGHPIVYGSYGPISGHAIITNASGYAITPTNKSYIVFRDLMVRGGAGGYLVNGGVVQLEYCIVDGTSERGIYVGTNASTVTLYNCIFVDNAKQGVFSNGASANITARNCSIIGNGYTSFTGILRNTAGAVMDIDYCLVAGNHEHTVQNYTATGITDGGHNKFDAINPRIIAYPKNTAYFAITMDDYDITWMDAVMTAVNAYGSKATAFLIRTEITAPQEATIAAWVAAGNEAAVHSWQVRDMSLTTAFGVTSTNTTPTINIDVAGDQIILNCAEAGNRVTLAGIATKILSDLTAAVAGKGWTITATTNQTNAMQLSSLSDSGGAQSVPYTANLNITAPDYRFWRDEIADTAGWLASVTGVSPVTMAYPNGNNSAGLQSWLSAVAGFTGAAGTGNSDTAKLSSINLYNHGRLAASSPNFRRGATEADFREAARHIFVNALTTGKSMVIMCHSEAETPAAGLGYMASELRNLGASFQTFHDVAAAIRADHATADGITYTKTYTSILNARLLAASELRDAGVNLNIAADYDFHVVGNPPNIGAFE